jgi:hypothetical protein
MPRSITAIASSINWAKGLAVLATKPGGACAGVAAGWACYASAGAATSQARAASTSRRADLEGEVIVQARVFLRSARLQLGIDGGCDTRELALVDIGRTGSAGLFVDATEHANRPFPCKPRIRSTADSLARSREPDAP